MDGRRCSTNMLLRLLITLVIMTDLCSHKHSFFSKLSTAFFLKDNKFFQSHLGRAASLPLTAENGLGRCVCYYLCNAHCRRVQSFSHRYATSTLHRHLGRHTTTAYIYRARLASRDKNSPNSNLADIYSKKSSSTSYHPSATKVICEELRSHH